MKTLIKDKLLSVKGLNRIEVVVIVMIGIVLSLKATIIAMHF